MVCATRFSIGWEQPDQGYIDKSADMKKAVVCVQRGGPTQTLLDAAVVDPATGTCTSGYALEYVPPSSARLCAERGGRRTVTDDVYVADLKFLCLTTGDSRLRRAT